MSSFNTVLFMSLASVERIILLLYKLTIAYLHSFKCGFFSGFSCQ